MGVIWLYENGFGSGVVSDKGALLHRCIIPCHSIMRKLARVFHLGHYYLRVGRIESKHNLL